ncbi:MAG: cytochrome c [Bryobacteraceae bacterium]
MWIPTNLHEDRVLAFNDGEIFHVITNGRRSMPSYRFQVTEADRWAIVAYVRALQRTMAGGVEDVPQELRSDLR